MLPRDNFEKKIGAICCILSIPKYAIINLKINYLKDNKSKTTNIIRPIFSFTDLDVHVNKQIHLIRMVWAATQKPKIFFKKIKQN